MNRSLLIVLLVELCQFLGHHFVPEFDLRVSDIFLLFRTHIPLHCHFLLATLSERAIDNSLQAHYFNALIHKHLDCSLFLEQILHNDTPSVLHTIHSALLHFVLRDLNVVQRLIRSAQLDHLPVESQPTLLSRYVLIQFRRYKQTLPLDKHLLF